MSYHQPWSSLQQWLETTGEIYRHSDDYRKWNVKRPSEEARKLIKGILVRLCEIHERDSYHGVLNDPNNYLFQRVNSHQLPHEWRYEVSFHYKTGPVMISSVKEGQKYDTMCVRKMIFGQILPDNIGTYTEDLQELHSILVRELDENNLHKKFVANHPSLWDWLDRFNFFHKFSKWLKYGREKKELNDVLRYVSRDYSSWQQWIPDDSPLRKMLNDKSFSYDNTRKDLLRFVRNAFEHVTDSVSPTDVAKKYIGSSTEWTGEMFVENQVTQMFPHLLVDVYYSMVRYDREVCECRLG